MSIIIFLIILLVLVLVHELGHFFSAKSFGIRVDEFGFGFPPKLFGWKYGETEYSFNLFPLGGFVKIFGESPDAFNIAKGEGVGDYDRSLISKAKWQQAIVLVAGVCMNFLLAWFLFAIGFMSGFPTAVGREPSGSTLEDVHLVVISVVAKSPAERAGLESGDKILYVGSGEDKVLDVNPESLRSFVQSHKDKQIEIGYTRGASEGLNFATMTPAQSGASGEPQIGIAMDEVGIAKLALPAAFWEGLRLTLSITKSTATGLYTLIIEAIRGRGSLESVTGPVGLVGIVGDAYKFGFTYLLSFAGLISINLAIINLLPFPALDGGRLFFLLVEKIKGSAINPKVANTANMIGFGILILLMIVITYHDVVKLL